MYCQLSFGVNYGDLCRPLVIFTVLLVIFLVNFELMHLELTTIDVAFDPTYLVRAVLINSQNSLGSSESPDLLLCLESLLVTNFTGKSKILAGFR